MKTSTILVLGGIGAAAYFLLFRNKELPSTLPAASGLPPASNLPSGSHNDDFPYPETERGEIVTNLLEEITKDNGKVLPILVEKLQPIAAIPTPAPVGNTGSNSNIAPFTGWGSGSIGTIQTTPSPSQYIPSSTPTTSVMNTAVNNTMYSTGSFLS